MNKIKISGLLFIFILTACAAPQTKTQKGGVYGAAGGTAAGAIIGQIIGRDTQSTLWGAAIGAAVGGLGGAGVGKMMEIRKEICATLWPLQKRPLSAEKVTF